MVDLQLAQCSGVSLRQCVTALFARRRALAGDLRTHYVGVVLDHAHQHPAQGICLTSCSASASSDEAASADSPVRPLIPMGAPRGMRSGCTAAARHRAATRAAGCGPPRATPHRLSAEFGAARKGAIDQYPHPAGRQPPASPLQARHLSQHYHHGQTITRSPRCPSTGAMASASARTVRR